MWQGILGHDDVAEHFRATLHRGRLASTYLFVGPAGIGKRRFALALAKALLCQNADDLALEPCGRCESCRLFDAGSHPDLDLVGLPKDKSTLPLELFIGDKEHRNQDGLCHRIALRPFLGGRKVAIIDDADRFSQESANCLLKTLEEPPPRSLVILIGTSPSKQLPTIRSRLADRAVSATGGGNRCPDPAGRRHGYRARICRSVGILWRGKRPAGPGIRRSRAVAVSCPATARSGVGGAQSRSIGQGDSGVCRRRGQGSFRAAGPVADSRVVRRGILSRPAAVGHRRRNLRGRVAAVVRCQIDRTSRPIVRSTRWKAAWPCWSR